MLFAFAGVAELVGSADLGDVTSVQVFIAPSFAVLILW